MEFFLFWVGLSIVAAIFAGSRGRSAGLALLLALIFSPILVFMVYLILGHKQKCPYCKGGVFQGAAKCKNCGSELVQAVSANSMQPEAGVGGGNSPKKVNLNRIFWLTIGLFVLAAFIVEA